VTVIVTPLVMANVVSEQDTTFAAVPAAVELVPVNALIPLIAEVAVVFAEFAVLTAAEAFVFAVFAVDTAADALVFAVLAVDTAEEAFVFAVFAVVFASSMALLLATSVQLCELSVYVVCVHV